MARPKKLKRDVSLQPAGHSAEPDKWSGLLQKHAESAFDKSGIAAHSSVFGVFSECRSMKS